MSSPRPRRRHTTHVETLHRELCIYEWTTKTVHALNPVAARVWEMCDGTTTVTEMITAVQRDEDTPDATLIVQHALAQFERAGLLEPDVVVGAPPVSRRRLLQTIGVAAIPVVTSIVAPTPAAAQSGRSIQFDWTGAAQAFTVPAGITLLQVDVVGASGAAFFPVSPSGNAGRVQAMLPVTPGEILTVTVGMIGSLAGIAGFNGGGPAGVNGAYAGGDASDIRRGSTRVVVAGGGGGAGLAYQLADGGAGGAGGGLSGAAGTGVCGGGGGGGTQSAGGVGGTGGSGGASGSPGVFLTGGKGADGPPTGGGGGGGGYFGGGGGGGCGNAGRGGAGGGGSSFADPSAIGVVHTQGYRNGVGVIILTW